MSFAKNNVVALGVAGLILFVMACSGGGGCSTCAGCGIEPIPGGYPIADRIENSAQIRLTQSGVDFVERNIDPIIMNFLPDGLDFPVPRTDSGSGLTRVTVCTDDNCSIHAEIRNLDLTPTAPNTLTAAIQLVVDSRDLSGPPGARRGWPLRTALGTCDMDLDTRRGSREYIEITSDIRFVTETEAARAGYTRVVVENTRLTEDIQDQDISFSGCFVSWLLNAVRGILIGQLAGQIDSLLTGALDDALCQTQGDYGCPTGTVAAGPDPSDLCEFTSGGRCVPILLGTDGQGDLGSAFLGGFSPGTHGAGQFLLAAGGDGEAVNNGMSIFMFGGWRSTDSTFMTSPAHNPCVPVVDPPPLPVIPRADTFRENTIPGTGTPSHVGIGLSEQYLNHVGYGLYDGGMLCLGVGTRLSQQISTGLFSVLINSLTNLSFPEESAPLSIAIRPQAPPVFEVGAGDDTEALLTVTLPGVEMDFYVWSTERYIRFMTYKADLGIPINLRVQDGQIVPEITEVLAADSSVMNSELLQEDTTTLAGLIEAVITMFAGMLSGAINPIDLPAIMGFDLTVPDGGITGVEDSGEEFLGIFANLSVAGAMMPLTAAADTEARLESLEVDPRVLALETFGDGEIPSAVITADAFGPHGSEYEYSWRVDDQQWSRWSDDRRLVVQDQAFLLQARHRVDVRARVAGAAGTHDESPARVEVLIDALAPDVTAVRESDGVRVSAFDVISHDDLLEARHRMDEGAWSEWQTLGEELFVPVAFADSNVDVEVRDEAGNVGTASSALIRGLPDPNAEGGCSCDVPGGSEGAPVGGGIALLALLGLFLRRRRKGGPGRPKRGRSLLSSLTPFLVVFLFTGCDCGGDGTTAGPCNDMCVPAMGTATNGTICCESTDMCVVYDLVDLCDPGFVCASADAVTLDDSCGAGCSDCMRQPALAEGLLATHLDIVVEGSGSVAVSGYSPGDPSGPRYGDLVFGMHDPMAGTTAWEIVDGAPASPVTNDPDGYRGGVSAPGDDVGRWTSMIQSADGTYYISYYDRTNGDLKLAIGTSGSWNVQIVDPTGDSGRYSSIALDVMNNPVIAYLRITEAMDGSISSAVEVAMTSTPTPTGPPDWLVTEVGTATMPCRPQYCEGVGETCIDSPPLCVTDTGDCGGGCMPMETCYMGSCAAQLEDPYVEDMPPGYGLYNSLVVTPGGLALVFYDRTQGNIMGSAWDGTAWSTPFLIDGWGAGDTTIGDSGIGASLYVDDSDVWHVTYADGAEETLRYARIEGGTPATEVVDDGSTDGSAPNPDGRHIIGDDSSIAMTPSGTLRIVYQDATTQRSMLAVRDAMGSPWTISVLDDMDHTGFWLEQFLVGDTSFVGTWWRNETNMTNGVRVVTVP